MEGISPENHAVLKNRYRAACVLIIRQIVFSASLIALVWYFAPKLSSDSISQQTLTTLWVLIIFLALAAFILRRAFFRWDRLKDIALLKGIPNLLKTLQTNAVILSIFATLITFVGCAITVLSGENFQMLRAGVVALIVFLINFPRRRVWEKIVAGMEKV